MAFGFGGGDFKGINTESIATAKTAINDYITAIENHLSSLQYGDLSGAFKGAYSSMVKTAVDEIAATAKKVVEQLATFDEEIQLASDRYAAKDSEITFNSTTEV